MQTTKVKHGTGPLPAFDTDAPLADHVKHSAWIYLDDMKGSTTKQNMIDSIMIQYGMTQERAESVYKDRLKVQE